MSEYHTSTTPGGLSPEDLEVVRAFPRLLRRRSRRRSLISERSMEEVRDYFDFLRTEHAPPCTHADILAYLRAYYEFRDLSNLPKGQSGNILIFLPWDLGAGPVEDLLVAALPLEAEVVRNHSVYRRVILAPLVRAAPAIYGVPPEREEKLKIHLPGGISLSVERAKAILWLHGRIVETHFPGRLWMDSFREAVAKAALWPGDYLKEDGVHPGLPPRPTEDLHQEAYVEYREHESSLVRAYHTREGLWLYYRGAWRGARRDDGSYLGIAPDALPLRDLIEKSRPKGTPTRKGTRAKRIRNAARLFGANLLPGGRGDPIESSNEIDKDYRDYHRTHPREQDPAEAATEGLTRRTREDLLIRIGKIARLVVEEIAAFLADAPEGDERDGARRARWTLTHPGEPHPSEMTLPALTARRGLKSWSGICRAEKGWIDRVRSVVESPAAWS